MKKMGKISAILPTPGAASLLTTESTFLPATQPLEISLLNSWMHIWACLLTAFNLCTCSRNNSATSVSENTLWPQIEDQRCLGLASSTQQTQPVPAPLRAPSSASPHFLLHNLPCSWSLTETLMPNAVVLALGVSSPPALLLFLKSAGGSRGGW